MILDQHPVLAVLVVAVLAPFLAEIPIGMQVPVVVLELLLGNLIGPHMLGLIRSDGFLTMMQGFGLSAMLFMAGMEIDFEQIRGRPLTLALSGWLASVGLAFAAVSLLHVIPGIHAPMMVTIALTTTGLGALLPILRDGGQLNTPFGRYMLAAGTVGEVIPIIALSLLLSQRFSTWQEFGFLIVFLVLIVLVAAIGLRTRNPKLLDLLSRTMRSSTHRFFSSERACNSISWALPAIFR